MAAWKKLGQLCSGPDVPWAVSHAALPVVEPMADGRHRVFFSSRDEHGRAQIGAATALLDDRPGWSPSPAPVLTLGPLGSFCDNGVTSSCIVVHGGLKYLYFTGWSLGVTVPFYLNIGVACSDDDGRTFRRPSDGPLFDRNAIDPFMTASPYVLIENGRWRMWYVSATGWVLEAGRPKHRYHIRYAESDDGIAWRRDGRVCIDFKNDDEYAIARPCVVMDGDRYRMWYSYRGDRYRIGYAESHDGLVWQRLDERAGIGVSADGWDSDMIEYPLIVDVGSRRFMLYNGNDYGRTGIGLAVEVAS